MATFLEDAVSAELFPKHKIILTVLSMNHPEKTLSKYCR